MGDGGSSSGEVVNKLTEMGFEYSDIMEAIRAVGPSINHAAEYILNGCCGSEVASSSNIRNVPKKASLRSFVPPKGKVRQSCILDHFPSSRRKRGRTGYLPDATVFEVEEEDRVSLPASSSGTEATLEGFAVKCGRKLDIVSDWEEKANCLLQKHFGYSGVKSFQKEALAAWAAHRDCLVLAATGSGKSLCFQIPALLTGKVVVVISPLISLMHDQCLKLAKHGVSACFLGSGQPDSTVEQKALRGVYSIIYVCPETVLRLIKPLQGLAESRGIALFAIDEVHCVSKWGHDFRPDYRKLSVLRETFSASKLKYLEYDIPLMALTATATVRVREDIIKSLCMSKETAIVLTSFFRPNLRFAVKHTQTSNPSSYEENFLELINTYTKDRNNGLDKQVKFSRIIGDAPDHCVSSINNGISDTDTLDSCDMNDLEDGCTSGDSNEIHSAKASKLSVEYLEDETDIFQRVDDWDVAFGEFDGQFPCEEQYASKVVDPPMDPKERLKLCQQPLDKGPTIIYVPTRKQTLSISKYLCRFGVKAAAYNAGLPKSHLRKVHREFQDDILEVVIATIAFGMGIDKLNVRRIIHYGWPQSLEAYYQEAGRAGRDGKLADCTLYANLSKIPSLLPSRRNEDQTKQAYKMLSDCFRYGMSTSCCRVKTLVEYFGEDFRDKKCLMCDVCVSGPPEMRNVKEEVDIIMRVITAHCNTMGRTSFRILVSKIREQSQKFVTIDLLWWQGLARILESKGYIREGDDKNRVQIKFPEPTRKGVEFLQSNVEDIFYVYPEADMLLSMNNAKSFSTFAEWGKGWADPEIRRKRLESKHTNKKPWKQRSRRSRSKKHKPDLGTARGRIASKLFKKKG